MTRLTTLIIALSLSGWFATADTITLKHEAYVNGPKVLLGDVAYIEGENAEALRSIEVARAALPGASRRIDMSLVRSRIQNAGYDQDSFEVNSKQRAVTATTMHLDLSKELLAENLRDHIEVNMPWDPEDTLIDIVPPTSKILIADGDFNIIWRTNPAYKYLGQGSFRGDITVDGRLVKTVYAKANIKAYAEVLIAKGNIAPRRIA